jgi:hypothetical protein
MSDDDSDDELFLSYVTLYDRPRIIRDRSNLLECYDEDKFRERFRLSKVSTLTVLTKIEHHLEYASNRNAALSPIHQLLITLRYYATGTFQLVISDLSGVVKSTVCRTVHKVSRALASLRSQYIKFPMSDAERMQTMREFYAIAQFPGVLGSIDCTHVPMQSPGGDAAEIYRNRKGYFSINVQTIANARLLITDIVAHWYGSAHDVTIFNNCWIRAKFENEAIGAGHLLGDNGYGVKPYLLTPLLSPITEADKRYNKSQISTRNTVERSYGIWKRRFPAIKLGMRVNVENALVIIVATAVLHNIALGAGEEDPPEDVELRRMLEDQRRTRPAYRIYDDVPDEVVKVPDRPAGASARSGQATRQRIITEYFTWYAGATT